MTIDLGIKRIQSNDNDKTEKIHKYTTKNRKYM